jgi:Protein of unknown function (DUF1194)
LRLFQALYRVPIEAMRVNNARTTLLSTSEASMSPGGLVDLLWRHRSVTPAGAGATDKEPSLRPPFFNLAALLLVSLSALAEHDEQLVDLDLVIAVDVSLSMNYEEKRVQREGYASALRNPEVMRAIKSGARGRIAIVYMEWAGPGYQRVLAPWTVIADPAGAGTVADAIEEELSFPQAGTSISDALLFAGELLRINKFRSDRQTIDISGDGPNNSGPPVGPIRGALINRGVTINGLAISLPGDEYMTESFDLDFIRAYYASCVIGGPGSFVLSVSNLADFEKAIRLKLVSEIAEAPAWPQFAAHSGQYPRISDFSRPG